MKKLLCMLTLGFAFSGISYAGKSKSNMYKVTVINLTKGQPITPPVVAVHAPGHVLFQLGQPASPGLAALSQDGVTDVLTEDLEKDYYVVRSAVGSEVILPGKSSEILVEANNPNYKFTVLAMLARTNDAFIAAEGLSYNLKKGQKAFYLAKTYDAGAEQNTELCAHIPAPPCNNPMKSYGEGEGFIRPHEGIGAHGDLISTRDTFANVAAKIIIEPVN